MTADLLARSGVGYLRLIDQDIVEPSNLHRLIGVGPEQLYHPKAEAVAKKIAATNPWVRLEPIVETLTLANVGDLLDGSHLIVDGLDNFRTRHYLNQYSTERRVPYVFASAIATQGHVAVFCPPETPCLECAFPRVLAQEDTCETLGIVPSAAGTVGGIAAAQTIRLLLGLPTLLKGRLLTVDLAGPEFMTSTIPRRADCEVCGPTRRKSTLEGMSTILCGEKTFNVVPPTPLSLDLSVMSKSLSHERILVDTGSLLVYQTGELVVSLFETGRMLIKGASGSHQALSIANGIWKTVSEITQATPDAL